MPSVYTRDIDDQFFTELALVAEYLEADPADMIAVMYSESGVKATAHNPNGDASGLIQFMPATLEYVGWMKGNAAFRVLSAREQLPYVRRYYAPHRGKLGSRVALYLATFMPALLDHASEPDFVLAARGGGRSGIIFEANAAFDEKGNDDGKIQVHELDDAIERNDRGKRWDELQDRMGAKPGAEPDPDDLGTIFGLQNALHALGFDPGDIDGLWGPKTRTAVQAYQLSVKLPGDGIYGPKTRASLTA